MFNKSYIQIKKNLKKSFSGLKKNKLAILGDSSTQFLKTIIRGLGYDYNMDMEIWEADYDQIPSKKTIFPHLAKSKNDIRYIKDLYKNLDILNIDYISLLEVFNKQSEIMYYLHDTHINELGHKLIKNEVSSFILTN